MAALNDPAAQPDFNLISHSLRITLGEIEKLPNLPAIAGGNIILAEIQQMRNETRAEFQQIRNDIQQVRIENRADIQQVRNENRADIQQMRLENREQFGRLHTVMSTNDYNSAARVQNTYLSTPLDFIFPFHNPSTGAVIPGFPGTSAELDQMAEHDVDAVLQQLGVRIDKDSSTPRVYLFRHGETEWTISGRYTGVSEVPLTANGEQQVLSTGRVVIGRGKLVDPARISRVFVSPRQRAWTAFDLLFGAAGEANVERQDSRWIVADSKVQVTVAISEWGYGAYEGLLTEQIRARRKAHGLDRDRAWDIWRDGCEGEGAE
ncbi:hypothetical protein DV736_g4713, partial [Chaetothyriales sp. CBS 134916]